MLSGVSAPPSESGTTWWSSQPYEDLLKVVLYDIFLDIRPFINLPDEHSQD